MKKYKSFAQEVRRVVGRGKSEHTGRGSYICNLAEGVVTAETVGNVLSKLGAYECHKIADGVFEVVGSSRRYGKYYRTARFVLGEQYYTIRM